MFSKAHLVVEVDAIFRCINSFPKGTSCGRDGLQAQHLLEAVCGKGFAMSRDILCEIIQVVSLWLRGRCPISLADFVASTPLTMLLKTDGRIRPIAIGSI